MLNNNCQYYYMSQYSMYAKSHKTIKCMFNVMKCISLLYITRDRTHRKQKVEYLMLFGLYINHSY